MQQAAPGGQWRSVTYDWHNQPERRRPVRRSLGEGGSPKGEAHPAALAALQYLNALGFEEKQDFLFTFSSLALKGNRLAEVCYGTLRRIIDGEPVSDRYVLGLAWEINSIKTRREETSP